MSNKRAVILNTIWLTVIVLAAVLIIVGIKYSAPKATAVEDVSAVQTGDNPSNRVSSFDEDPSQSPIYADPALNLPGRNETDDASSSAAVTQTSTTVNGVNIELRTVQRVDEYLQAVICYELPSEADWGPGDSPGDVVLNVGGKTIPIWGYKLVDLRMSSDGKPTHRCDALSFPVTSDQDLSEFTITIHRLVTSVPEQPDCNKAQEKLSDSNSGMIIQCNHGENSFGYGVLQKPASISEAQARDLAYEAFKNVVDGPWILAAGFEK